MIHKFDIEYMAYSNYRLHCLEPIDSMFKQINLLSYLDVV